MSRQLIILSILSVTTLLSGCAAIHLQPGAEKVQISQSKPSRDCKFLGTVTANQGNSFTGSFTSNANMQEGAFNDLRNKAAALNGNYVQIIADQAGVTGSGGGSFQSFSMNSEQTNYTSSGSVFRCPR